MAIRNVRLDTDEILRKKSKKVEEIDDKIKTETNGEKRVKLMMEQLLRGLYLNQNIASY